MSDMRITGDGSSVYNGITVSTPYESNDKGVKVEDFLNLMVAQLTNQDFLNPVDDTQYVTQLAQFATMQSMQELSHYSQTSYVANLVGKTVTVASLGIGGSVNKDVGVVSSVNLSGDSYTFTVNGKSYELNQIMSIDNTESGVSKEELEEANNIALIVMDTARNSVKFRWYAPKDGEDGLTYSVYYSTDGSDMTTLAGVKKATLAASDLTELEYELTGLDAGTTYFVNVVVTSPNGDEAIYQRRTVTTSA